MCEIEGIFLIGESISASFPNIGDEYFGVQNFRSLKKYLIAYIIGSEGISRKSVDLTELLYGPETYVTKTYIRDQSVAEE